MISRWLALAIFLSGATAGASEGDPGCPDPSFNERRLSLRLDQARRALDAADLTEARRTLAAVGSSLPCLRNVVSRPALARFARLMSEATFYRQEESSAVRWALVARLAEPDHPWPSLAEDHPLRARLQDAELPPLGGPRDRGLKPPPGGAIFMNGALALRAEAHAELPYLVQLLDSRIDVVAAYWQDGAVFPEPLLSDDPAPYPTPSWVVEGRLVSPSRSPRNTPRASGPRFPVTPVIAGATLALAAAGTGALSSATFSRVPDQTDADEADRLRGTANTLAILSGAAAAGAVGVGVGGLLLSPTGAELSIRF